jgi:hypothetical protein
MELLCVTTGTLICERTRPRLPSVAIYHLTKCPWKRLFAHFRRYRYFNRSNPHPARNAGVDLCRNLEPAAILGILASCSPAMRPCQ